MSITSTLTGKNQTTIPKAIVEALRIQPSSILQYEIEADGRVVLTAKSATFEGLVGSFPSKRPKKTVSVEQMASAARAGAVKRFRKARP